MSRLSASRSGDRRPAPRRFLRDRSGAAAVEFAFILPVLVLVYFAIVELSLLMDADRKVSSTASVIGDLVAQTDKIDQNQIDAIFEAADALMQPLDVGEMELRVSSVVMDNDGDVEVTWSRASNTDPLACGVSVSTPDGVLEENQSVIVTEVAYTYVPPVGHFLTGDIEIADTFYLRPRRSVQVAFNPPPC